MNQDLLNRPYIERKEYRTFRQCKDCKMTYQKIHGEKDWITIFTHDRSVRFYEIILEGGDPTTCVSCETGAIFDDETMFEREEKAKQEEDSSQV